MNSIAPWQAASAVDMARSEGFAEDLQEAGSAEPRVSQPPVHPLRLGSRLSTTLLCVVPLVVAVLGGVVAFFHTVG